jgi:hypothetical protein
MNYVVYLSRRTLFYDLERRGKAAGFRLTQKQMNMFRHDDIADHSKQIFLACLFQNLEKDIPPISAAQKGEPMVTTEGDEMEIVPP